MGKYRHLLLDVYSACKNQSQLNNFTVSGENKEHLQYMFSPTQREMWKMVHMNQVFKTIWFSFSAEGAQSDYSNSCWDKCPWRNLVLRVRLLVWQHTMFTLSLETCFNSPLPEWDLPLWSRANNFEWMSKKCFHMLTRSSPKWSYILC